MKFITKKILSAFKPVDSGSLLRVGTHSTAGAVLISVTSEGKGGTAAMLVCRSN